MTSLKACAIPGCPTLSPDRLCPTHRREQRRHRGDPPGLHEHRKTRARLLPLAVGKLCPICNEPMLATQALDLDHSVPRALDSTSKGDRIVHAGCNRSRGGKLGQQIK